MKFLYSCILVISLCVLLVNSSSIPESTDDEAAVLEAISKNLFEGDIAGITKNERGAFQKPTKTADIWPNGKVPYFMSPSTSSYSSLQLQTVRDALKHIEDSTSSNGQKVVKFIECTSESEAKQYSTYIKVVKSDGCWSYPGRQKKEKFQYLSLGFGCYSLGIVAHEFMHALGFFHEQSRPDRDNYVTILYQNIKKGNENNFDKYDWSVVGLRQFPYDYGSLMHYGETTFSSNGQPTIVPKKSGVTIGQRISLSSQDADEIRAVYSSGNKSHFIGFYKSIFLFLAFWTLLKSIF